MAIIRDQQATLGVAPACRALAVSRASFYRGHTPNALGPAPAGAPGLAAGRGLCHAAGRGEIPLFDSQVQESAGLAQHLIPEPCARQGIAEGNLTIHADRGPSMSSKPVALLLADLGVTKSQGRPHVSNDHPYSESAFKTPKYHPAFPDRFVRGRPKPLALPQAVGK